MRAQHQPCPKCLTECEEEGPNWTKGALSMLDVIVDNAGAGNGGETSTETSENDQNLFDRGRTSVLRHLRRRGSSHLRGRGLIAVRRCRTIRWRIAHPNPSSTVTDDRLQIHHQHPWT